MDIAILGANGMLGHVMYQYYISKGYNITTFGRQRSDIYLDAENLLSVKKVLTEKHFDFIINCIGVLVKESKENPVRALRVNSVFPKFLESLFIDTNTKIIQISTDCVFSGKIGSYTEDSIPDAQDVYGISKSLGEINNYKDLTIRASIIGPEIREEKTGLLEWFISNSEKVTGYTDAIWNGVTTLQLSKTLEEYISNPCIKGIWHPVGNSLSKYELLKLLKDTWTGPTIEKGVGPYPVDKTLKSTKIFFKERPTMYTQLLELKNFYDIFKQT